MRRVDAVVIGGGLLGCFTARNLCRWNLSVLLIEQEPDVCTGITRANSAVVYAGYDNKPGTLKAKLTVQGNAAFDTLCRELDVPFHRCGSLMVACDENAERVLQKKLQQGLENGVPGLKLLSGRQARELEPTLTDRVTAALYAPTTGTVNPWQLGIAACENAVYNGCELLTNTAVTGIERISEGYLLQTDKETVHCRAVVNCAGLSSDRVQELAFPPSVRLRLDAADYLILDRQTVRPERVIFHQDGVCGKGITAVPCVEGNLLLSGSRRDLEQPFATTAEGLQNLISAARRLLPDADFGKTMCSFGAVRPNPHEVAEKDGAYVFTERSIGSFCVEHPAAGFFSLIGIKTPGLTCADVLGAHVAQKLAAELGAEENPLFRPHRKAIRRMRDLSAAERAATVAEEPDYGEVVCLCEDVTKGEIMESIRRGANSVDGVKRRTGCTMGRCQGGRCTQRIEELLEQYLER